MESKDITNSTNTSGASGSPSTNLTSPPQLPVQDSKEPDFSPINKRTVVMIVIFMIILIVLIFVVIDKKSSKNPPLPEVDTSQSINKEN